jgi:hypothetical protein
MHFSGFVNLHKPSFFPFFHHQRRTGIHVLRRWRKYMWNWDVVIAIVKRREFNLVLRSQLIRHGKTVLAICASAGG